ncbi:MAG TPA: transposase family protein, partial [Saprospiraceae bacterium]|nr:transposase family protein [Saprospiraceae bacterium]
MDKKVLLDLGFQGFQNLYDALETLLPHKRKQAKKGENNTLTESQQQENKAQAQARIYVEHSIGGIKRFR